MQTSSSTETDETIGLTGGAAAVVGREVEAAEESKLSRRDRRAAKKAAKMAAEAHVDKRHAFKLWL